MSHPVFDPSSFQYSDPSRSDDFETRYVRVPQTHWSHFPRDHLLEKTEWRDLGIQMSRGWRHTGYLPGEPWTLVFIRGIRHGLDIATPRIHAGMRWSMNTASMRSQTVTPTTPECAVSTPFWPPETQQTPTTQTPIATLSRPQRIKRIVVKPRVTPSMPMPTPRILRSVITTPKRPRTTPKPTTSYETPKLVRNAVGFPRFMSTGRTTSTETPPMTTPTRIPTPRVTRIVVTPRVAQRLSPELSPYIIAPSTTPRTENGFLRATRLSLGTPVLNNLKNSILAVVIQFMRGETNQSSPQDGAPNASPSEAPTTAALMLTLQLTTSIIMMLQKETAMEHVSAADPEANKPLMASDSDDDIIKALQGMSLEPPKSTIQTPSVVKKYIVYKNTPEWKKLKTPKRPKGVTPRKLADESPGKQRLQPYIIPALNLLRSLQYGRRKTVKPIVCPFHFARLRSKRTCTNGPKLQPLECNRCGRLVFGNVANPRVKFAGPCRAILHRLLTPVGPKKIRGKLRDTVRKKCARRESF